MVFEDIPVRVVDPVCCASQAMLHPIQSSAIKHVFLWHHPGHAGTQIVLCLREPAHAVVWAGIRDNVTWQVSPPNGHYEYDHHSDRWFFHFHYRGGQPKSTTILLRVANTGDLLVWRATGGTVRDATLGHDTVIHDLVSSYRTHEIRTWHIVAILLMRLAQRG